ncbi:MAG: pilus assembly protein N-terminal domain-containing protein [Spirochaetes bacterium]|nr:pilus assembly protein N-terminal domain-containing protein [Spirochaetota bacterium]
MTLFRNIIIIILLFLIIPPVYSQEKIFLFKGESKSMTFDTPVNKISIGDKQIAGVRALSSTEILLTGKNIGVTSIIIWTDEGTKLSKEVVVSEADLGKVMGEVRDALRRVKGVSASMKKEKIVLEGRVEDDRDVTIISGLLSKYRGVITSFVSLPVQMIKINARVVEISGTYERNLGVDWQRRFNFQENDIRGVYQVGKIERLTKLDAWLEAQEKEGKAKIIARPNIIVVNGQTAEFHSGGKILIPMFSEGQVASVDEKEYGVKLFVVPSGDRQSGLIHTAVNIEVSSLDWKNGVAYSGGTIPAIKTRNLNTIIDIKLGKTIVIGGLLMDEEEEFEQRVPILGHIPLLGLLFKYTEKKAYKTELAIFLTPSFINFIGEEISE